MIRIVKTAELAYNRAEKQAVYDGDELLGHVFKDERNTPIRARSGNYSVGTRVEKGWRFDLARTHARLAEGPLSVTERDRLRHLATGFVRTRKEGAEELATVVGLIDQAVLRARRAVRREFS